MSENKKEQTVALKTLFAVKAGMSRVFDENGSHIPVTVFKLIPNKVSQVKTLDKDGLNSYQVAFGEKKEKLVPAAKKGVLKKASIDEHLFHFAEVPVEKVDAELLGAQVSPELFTPGLLVDVTGVSKGKGFQGVMKRHNFSGGPAAHGSHFHRRPGSIGNRATPARVFPEKKLPGHLGDEKVTVQNLTVVALNEESGHLLIKGGVPGSKNSIVKISHAIKQQ